MKRIGNIREYLVSPENGLMAVIRGTENKRKKREVQRLLYSDEVVDEHPELWRQVDPEKAREYIAPVCKKLANGTWKHHEPIYRRQFCRAASGGKWRDLFIPCLEDHIVHHMVMQACMKAFTRGMHPHCCGSVPGRGIKHIVHWVRYWMQEDKECRYFVKLDIRKFFPSIDRNILYDVLKTKIKDPFALSLFEQILDSAPQSCPVGYYPSPWLSNLYLEELDWFIEQQLYKERRGKRIKYVRHHLRYADDILLIGTSKSDLEKAIRAIRKYTREKRNLDIKQEWEIKAIGKHELIDGKWKMKPGTYWCDIGGYKFCKDAMVLRDGVFLSASRLAKRMGKQGFYTDHQCQSINARIAWADQAGSENFKETYIKPYVNIKKARRQISELDKVRKLRRKKTGPDHQIRKPGNSEPEFQKD